MDSREFGTDELRKIDQELFDFLMNFNGEMPKRFGKFLAMYYPDARIRRRYSEYIGVEMQEGTYANLGLKIVPNDSKICVHVGKYVSIAPNVTFICSSSANNGTEINTLDYVNERLTREEDIFVEDNVWIGANVTIMPGVTIGRCSVIGAGSIVFNNVEPYSVYAGVPAKKIRDLRTGQRVNNRRSEE